jgi:predicted TIM-barrel fold metal-dependent hydrolase
MTYAAARAIHDADSHLMETPEMLQEFADPVTREQIDPQYFFHAIGPHRKLEDFAIYVRNHVDPAYRERDEAELMLRKNWNATGSFLREDRTLALDLLGFKSQLVFNTFWNGYLVRLEQSDKPMLAYGVARAHNRAMLHFCSLDRRLLATCYVPLVDFEESAKLAGEAITSGANALLIPSACPIGHSPSHIKLDPVWRQAEEAGIPIVMHVGGGGKLISPDYFENGLPPVKDFHGGDENFRSVDFMAIPAPPAQTLATLIIDGVLERFPGLKFGIIEQGAIWIPGLMRQLESALEAFGRHEERLRKLSLRPSEYIRRQVRATPYPTEDVGWIIEQAGEEICLFSSDYPHVEGGRNPIKRFEQNLMGASEREKQRFYHDNFVDLMGRGLTSLIDDTEHRERTN